MKDVLILHLSKSNRTRQGIRYWQFLNELLRVMAERSSALDLSYGISDQKSVDFRSRFGDLCP